MVENFHVKLSTNLTQSLFNNEAKPMSRRVNNEGEFAYGAGQVNPRRALNPGLVYDMNEMPYIQFLCLEGYKDSSIAQLTGTKSINCSSLIPRLGYDALNYPTFQLTLRANSQKDTIGIYRRTVTNVGPAMTVYNATVRAPEGVEITVTPTSLFFSRTLQKRSFKVVVRAKGNLHNQGEMLSGSLVWKSSRYIVRSPIVVYSPYEDNNVHQVGVGNQNAS